MEAFERAYNLSGARGDIFYARQSLRHAAYMQSKCDNLESALENTRHWKGAGSSGDAPFDAARYAAKLKQWNVADELLDRAIDLNPSCYLAMLADDDLVDAPIIADLVERKCAQASERLASSKAEARELQRRLRADVLHLELDDIEFAYKKAEDVINSGEGVPRDDFFQLSSALQRVNAWTSRAQRAFVTQKQNCSAACNPI